MKLLKVSTDGQRKTDFETNADYENRLKTESEGALKKITDKVTFDIKKEYLGCKDHIGASLGKYDPETEIFKINLKYYNSLYFENSKIFIKIRKNTAENFHKLFSQGNAVYAEITDVAIINDQWEVTGVILYFGYQLSCGQIQKSLDSNREIAINESTNFVFSYGDVYSYFWNIEN